MKKLQNVPNVGPTETQAEQTAALKPRLSVQQRWAKSAQEGVERSRQMTNTQALAEFRRNSGWRAVAITELPKPGMGRAEGIKAGPSSTPPRPA